MRTYNHNKRITKKRRTALLNAARHRVGSRRWNKWMNRWVHLTLQYHYRKQLGEGYDYEQ